MGYRPIEKFANLNPVLASGIATADIPVAGTYYGVFLRCLDETGAEVSVANMKADIAKITMKLNGVNHIEMNADLIFDLMEYYYSKKGVAPLAGIIPLFFSPEWFENGNAEKVLMGYGMRDTSSMQLEVQFGAAAATVGHVNTVQVYVERIAESRPLGIHTRFIEYNRNFSSAGEQEIDDLPMEPASNRIVTAAWYLQYDGSAAVINNLEVIVNAQTVMNVTPVVLRQLIERSGRKWMVAGATQDLFPIPFNLANDSGGFLSHASVADIRFKVTWSAAPGAYKLFRESLHGVGLPN